VPITEVEKCTAKTKNVTCQNEKRDLLLINRVGGIFDEKFKENDNKIADTWVPYVEETPFLFRRGKLT